VAIEVLVETETWWVKEPDPTDRWDAGCQDGRVVGVEARVTTTEVDTDYTFYGRGHESVVFGCDAMEGETVFVVVADYTSGSTFGTSAGYFHVLEVTKSFEKAMGLARAAEAVSKREFEFEYDGARYYVPWTGYFEQLKEVRVWDCYLRPRLD
jgi:hypothetical protein